LCEFYHPTPALARFSQYEYDKRVTRHSQVEPMDSLIMIDQVKQIARTAELNPKVIRVLQTRMRLAQEHLLEL
jgi:hypothetical protein